MKRQTCVTYSMPYLTFVGFTTSIKCVVMMVGKELNHMVH